MKTPLELETILKHAPCPEPPADLLATLEQHIRLPCPAPSGPPPSLWQRWKKIWVPLAGLAGTAAVAIVIATTWGVSTTRTLAGSLQELGRMTSCRVVERYRGGPSRSVIVDKSKDVNLYPNFSTSEHPENPLVISDHWFQADAQNPARTFLRTVSPREDVWQQGNRVLTVNHETGARSLRLVSSPNRTLALLQPLTAFASVPLRGIKTPQMPEAKLDQASGLWVGETRRPDPSIPGAEAILRVWLNASNQLPERIQLLSTGFPQVAPEVVMREYQFSQYNATFPETTFQFDLYDQDLAPLGLTKASLEAMSNPLSFEVNGDFGTEVSGTVQDAGGIQQIHGTVPFTFVHDQHGDLQFELRMVDGKSHKFGVRFNGMDAWTVTSGVRGKSAAETLAASVQAF